MFILLRKTLKVMGVIIGINILNIDVEELIYMKLHDLLSSWCYVNKYFVESINPNCKLYFYNYIGIQKNIQ